MSEESYSSCLSTGECVSQGQVHLREPEDIQYSWVFFKVWNQGINLDYFLARFIVLASFLASAHSVYISVVVQWPSCVWLFVTPWTAAWQASRSLIISWSFPKFMSIALVMASSHLILWIALVTASSHLILWHPFLPSVFPASGSFPMIWLFTSGDQNIGASASALVLPMNIQGWFPLRFTGLISCSSRDSQESSPAPQFKGINSLDVMLSFRSCSHNHMWHWEDHSLDNMDLCQQSDVFVFQHTVYVCQSFPAKKQSSSWLLLPSTVILEPKKRKSVTASTFSPSICCLVMETDAMILTFLFFNI